MTDKRKREAPISYRPPESLREEFQARVSSSGLSVNAYITAAIFGSDAPRQARRPPLARQDLARLLAMTAALKARLETLPDEGDDQLQGEARRTLTDIRTLLLQAMGRVP